MASADQPPPPPGYGLLPTTARLLRQARPGTLFHYTNQSGLLGILGSGTLWASAIKFLNDASEYQVGLYRILQEIEARSDQDPSITELLKDTLEVGASWDAPSVGVVSFSEARDDLSQWRAYGGGSGGYCIGFDGAALMRQINQDGGVLVRVIYGDSEHSSDHDEIVRSICDDMIDGARNLAERKMERSAQVNQIGFQRRCNTNVQVICSILKHWAFHDEREWQAIILNAAGKRSRLRVRPGKSVPIPFYEVQIRDDAMRVNSLPIVEVVIGPNPHPDLARVSVEAALGVNDELDRDGR